MKKLFICACLLLTGLHSGATELILPAPSLSVTTEQYINNLVKLINDSREFKKLEARIHDRYQSLDRIASRKKTTTDRKLLCANFNGPFMEVIEGTASENKKLSFRFIYGTRAPWSDKNCTYSEEAAEIIMDSYDPKNGNQMYDGLGSHVIEADVELVGETIRIRLSEHQVAG